MISDSISKKVLMVCPNAQGQIGGISFVVHNILENIPNPKVLETFPSKSDNPNFLFFIGFVIRFLKLLILDKDIQLVHIHFASRGSFLRKLLVSFLAKAIFRKKVVLHLHGGGFFDFYNQLPMMLKPFVKSFFRNADAIIVLSKVFSELLEQYFPDLHLKPVVIRNFIPKPLDSPGIICGISGKVVFSFFGKLSKGKGVYDILNAINQSSKLRSCAIFLICGVGPEKENMERETEKFGLSDVIKYKGFISGTDKWQALYLTDVFVLPSYFEALPVSIIEAMTIGKAIVATKVGGVPDLVKDGINGFLIKPGAVEDLTMVLERFVDQPQLINSFGRESRKRSEKFTSEAVLPKLEGLYSSILNG